MLISKKHSFIFVHIYKTAGTSIKDVLLPHSGNPVSSFAGRVCRMMHIEASFDPSPYPAHISASAIIEKLGKDRFASYFSFAFVRNPWDWQVSLYKYMLKTPKHPQHELAKSFEDFDEYIRWRCAHEVKFQKDYICSESGEVLVDFVGKLETIDDHFAIVCQKIGISARLPKLNVSNTKPYQDYYSNESIELVRDTYALDIQKFDYDFDR